MEAAASPPLRAPLASISGFPFTRWTRSSGSPAGVARLSTPPPSLLLFRTLRRVHGMRPDLLELVTKGGRAVKLVHLRSPREMARWLEEVTRATAEVAD